MGCQRECKQKYQCKRDDLDERNKKNKKYIKNKRSNEDDEKNVKPHGNDKEMRLINVNELINGMN
jgi:hypothetical protein